MMSRVLKTGENQITQGYNAGSHNGIDLVKKTNQLDTIISHSPGTVVMIQTGYSNNPGSTGNSSYGNLVKIKHTNGYFTLYAHLASVSVYSGQSVGTGQNIGYMGNTGNSYGAHLHFEVRNTGDVVINPTSYINEDLPGLITSEGINEMDKAEITSLATQIANERVQAYFDELKSKAAQEWARPYLQQAIEMGIIEGDGVVTATYDNVRPQAYITREEVAKVVVKTIEILENKIKE